MWQFILQITVYPCEFQNIFTQGKYEPLTTSEMEKEYLNHIVGHMICALYQKRHAKKPTQPWCTKNPLLSGKDFLLPGPQNVHT
jgi:hypothetical protein